MIRYWAPYVIFSVCLLGLLAGMASCADVAAEDCHRKGGELVYTGGTRVPVVLCLKKGTVLE